jgi:hypothetical protein
MLCFLFPVRESVRAPFPAVDGMRGNGYPRLAISFVRENISTREGSVVGVLAFAAPDFCISRRIRANVFRRSVDALGT